MAKGEKKMGRHLWVWYPTARLPSLVLLYM